MPTKDLANFKATRNDSRNGKMQRERAKESKKGYPGVATNLGAKEWMNVCPTRRQLLLVRR
jgi:hypothetical protein